MRAGSEDEGGPLKWRKVKGEEAGVLQKNTPLPHTHTRKQQPVRTAGMRAEHMHAWTHPHTNYRVNSCSLTSRRCQCDWGEEKRRSNESRERGARGGKMEELQRLLWGDLLVIYSLLYTKCTKSPRASTDLRNPRLIKTGHFSDSLQSSCFSSCSCFDTWHCFHRLLTHLRREHKLVGLKFIWEISRMEHGKSVEGKLKTPECVFGCFFFFGRHLSRMEM